MSDEDALLDAIAASPDDDTPRLVFADWLDENAEYLPDPDSARVRAEFIRVQVEIARLESPEGASAAPLLERNRRLAEEHADELLGPLAGLRNVAEIRLRRGFVSRVSLAVDAFLTHAEEVAAVRPLPAVCVTNVAEDLGDFVRCPLLGVVSELSVYTPLWGRRGTLPDESEVVEGVNRLTRLSVMDIEGCGVGDWFCALLGNFALPALEELKLAHNAVGDVGVLDLLHTPHPRKLRRLVLTGNPVGEAGALWLADLWPRGTADRLERLVLRGTDPGPEGAAALVARFGPRVEL